MTYYFTIKTAPKSKCDLPFGKQKFKSGYHRTIQLAKMQVGRRKDIAPTDIVTIYKVGEKFGMVALPMLRKVGAGEWFDPFEKKGGAA